MKSSKDDRSSSLEDWYLDLAPSTLIFHSVQTGRRIVEPSYIAVKAKWEQPAENGPSSPRLITLGQVLAVGKAATAYQTAQDAVVFSPFRHGQIAHYSAAQYLFKVFLSQLCPKLPLSKPVLYVHKQERTTEVEERALIEAAIQAGARKVFLYREPLSVILDRTAEGDQPKNTVIIHIEPQN